ncbi:hypothetical protein EVAR_90858_1 [Eumeta japonica]|uniref:Uncharacterized protein n=1 Tax=Eumeta variegata TaxID=151549 RepID=A0A4C1ZX08_EUMVA|nr:hypothetical protein EVAR_90858_1 [Eumeta japonica]
MDQYTSDLLIKWGYSSTSVYLLNVTADVNETPLDSSFMGRLLRDLDNPSENCSPSTSIQRDSSCLAPESDNIENEVILILQKTLEGRAILAKGQHNNGLLNLELRKELANLIIRDKLQADPNKLLSGPSLLKISHQIATIFPQESPVHFYAPYLRATEFQTKRNTSGILYNAYSTRKRHLRSLGALPASKRSTSRRQSTNSDTKRTIPSGIIFEEHSTVEVAELLKNLEHPDPGPWQTIEQTWTSTLSARIHFLYQEKANKEESELNVSLLLLPFIINISPVRRKDSWKASRSEVRDGFITHVPTDREILVALAERREKLAKGVDGAFKIFHSTATEYPKESYDIWILLQLAFYDIQTDFDRPTAAVKQLMVDLHFKEKVKTGIREECCWFALKEFDLFENVAVDLMHDLWKELPDIL